MKCHVELGNKMDGVASKKLLINTKTQVVLQTSDAFYGLRLCIDQCPFVKFLKLNSCVTGKGCRENRVFLFKKKQSI